MRNKYYNFYFLNSINYIIKLNNLKLKSSEINNTLLTQPKFEDINLQAHINDTIKFNDLQSATIVTA